MSNISLRYNRGSCEPVTADADDFDNHKSYISLTTPKQLSSVLIGH